MAVWFTVRLDDRPGALAQLAGALADRAVNITGIVGVAEDTNGALMLTTSDPRSTREAFAELRLAFKEHDTDGDTSGRTAPEAMSVADVRRSRSDGG